MTATAGASIARVRHSRWLIALVAVPPVAAILTTVLAPDPHGHWSEHLASAALKGAQLALLLVLVTILRWRRRPPNRVKVRSRRAADRCARYDASGAVCSPSRLVLAVRVDFASPVRPLVAEVGARVPTW